MIASIFLFLDASSITPNSSS